jgi:hypothetical protein
LVIENPAFETLGYSQGKDAAQILHLALSPFASREPRGLEKSCAIPLQNGLGMLLVPGYG